MSMYRWAPPSLDSVVCIALDLIQKQYIFIQPLVKPAYRVSKPKIIPILSLLQTNPAPTKQNVEDNFDGNICRCTGESLYMIVQWMILCHLVIGYRPILEAMKTFTVNSDGSAPFDIEVSSHTLEYIHCMLHTVCLPPFRTWLLNAVRRTALSLYSVQLPTLVISVTQCGTNLMSSLKCLTSSQLILTRMWNWLLGTLDEVSIYEYVHLLVTAYCTGIGVFKVAESANVIVDLKNIAELKTVKVHGILQCYTIVEISVSMLFARVCTIVTIFVSWSPGTW